MLSGAFFHEFFHRLAFLTPYLIFCMLFITYCKLSFADLRFGRMHGWLLGIQVAGSAVVYGGLAWWDPVVAEGCLICVLAPTATAAAVVTGMLGGSVGTLAAYTLLSSVGTAFVAPWVFAMLGGHGETGFGASMWGICREVMPMLVVPCVAAFLLEKALPRVHARLKALQPVSFYLWAAGLTIVTGKTVFFIVSQEDAEVAREWWMAALALVICVAQFAAGRAVGRCYGDPISGGQALGQKNTILAIWMAQSYMNPLASVVPASYVLWQNLLNSYQLWRKENRHISA